MIITAEVDGRAVSWRDHKRHLWALGLVVPVLPLLAGVAVERTGWNALWWMGPVWILLLIPVLDWAIGTDAGNPPDWAIGRLEDDRYYRWLTFLFVPLQFASLLWASWTVTHADLSPFSCLGLALTTGAVGGIGIANAHELGHKSDRRERLLAKVVLAQTCYGHFAVEHNRGHHTRVATPEDPASSRLGESFWVFLPRTVIGSVRSAWAFEAARLRRRGSGPWTFQNENLRAWAMSVVLFGALTVACGPAILPFLAVQAVFGFSLLEVVNYLEHYGLRRQCDERGRYERCSPQHSWNSNHVASNLFLYQLERHSDHHAHPARRYQTLRHFEESPQLPSGYGLMLGLAYLPPVWRRVMDRRVVAHYGGDVTRANVQPGKLDELLARYGTTAS